MSARESGSDRRALQLAAQIARSVEMTLLGGVRDEVLENMSVEKVEPAPGNRMLVTLRVGVPGSRMPKEEVLDRLERHRRVIVDALARDVQRRGLPELSFWVVRDPDAIDGSSDDPPDDGEDDPAEWDAPSILDDP